MNTETVTALLAETETAHPLSISQQGWSVRVIASKRDTKAVVDALKAAGLATDVQYSTHSAWVFAS